MLIENYRLEQVGKCSLQAESSPDGTRFTSRRQNGLVAMDACPRQIPDTNISKVAPSSLTEKRQLWIVVTIARLVA